MKDVRSKNVRRLVIPGLSFLLATASLAQDGAEATGRPGYEEIEVTNGGTIVGVVTYRGSAPQPSPVHVSTDQQVCGETIPSPAYRITPKGEVQGVVVGIVEIDRGKPVPKEPVRIRNAGCMFEPHVQAITLTQRTVEVSNEDPVLHNVHASLGRRMLFNVGLPIRGMTVRKTLPGGAGTVHLTCDSHEWMEGWIVIFDHPYHEVTGPHGTFRIDSVPPGTYRLRAWHERLGAVEREVTVRAGEETRLDLPLEAEG